MFFEEMRRAMAGPYLSSFVDWYCSNQDVLNLVLVCCAAVWLVVKRRCACEGGGASRGQGQRSS